jgi:hypothetical protein
MAAIKGKTTNNFSSPFLVIIGSWIRDEKNQDRKKPG